MATSDRHDISQDVEFKHLISPKIADKKEERERERERRRAREADRQKGIETVGCSTAVLQYLARTASGNKELIVPNLVHPRCTFKIGGCKHCQSLGCHLDSQILLSSVLHHAKAKVLPHCKT